MLKLSAVFLSACLGTTLMAANPRDPMDEVANFKLDKASSRTSFAVSKGSIANTVARKVVDATGTSYGVRIDYDVTLKVTGNVKDFFEMIFPENFFTPDFMTELRKTGSYVSDQYKISYDGQADATNSDGSVFKNADILTIYDINLHDQKQLYQLLGLAAGFEPEELAVDDKALPMANMKIKAHIVQGIPALSAVKLDLTGKIKGVPTKLGFDLIQ